MIAPSISLCPIAKQGLINIFNPSTLISIKQYAQYLICIKLYTPWFSKSCMVLFANWVFVAVDAYWYPCRGWQLLLMYLRKEGSLLQRYLEERTRAFYIVRCLSFPVSWNFRNWRLVCLCIVDISASMFSHHALQSSHFQLAFGNIYRELIIHDLLWEWLRMDEGCKPLKAIEVIQLPHISDFGS